MARRLPRPTRRFLGDLPFEAENLDRQLQRQASSLRRRATSKPTVTLYRGATVNSSVSGGLFRMRSVREGSSWTTSPDLAARYAMPQPRFPGRHGSAGIVYAIDVPSSSIRGALANQDPTKSLPLSGYYSDRADYRTADGSDWRIGEAQGFSLIELRPTRNMPELGRPRIAQTVVLKRTDDGGAVHYRSGMRGGVSGGG